jgi:hypothetical protein
LGDKSCHTAKWFLFSRIKQEGIMNSTIGGISKMVTRSNHGTEVYRATYQFEMRHLT